MTSPRSLVLALFGVLLCSALICGAPISDETEATKTDVASDNVESKGRESSVKPVQLLDSKVIECFVAAPTSDQTVKDCVSKIIGKVANLNGIDVEGIEDGTRAAPAVDFPGLGTKIVEKLEETEKQIKEVVEAVRKFFTNLFTGRK